MEDKELKEIMQKNLKLFVKVYNLMKKLGPKCEMYFGDYILKIELLEDNQE